MAISPAEGDTDPALLSQPEPAFDCGIYLDGVRTPGRHAPAEALARVREAGAGFVWINAVEPDRGRIGDLARVFGLHDLAVENIGLPHQRPKLDEYDDALLMVFKTVRYVEHDSPVTANEIVESGEILVFLGADYVITVRHGPHPALHDARARLHAAPERMATGPAAVLHEVADRVVHSYQEVLTAFQDDLDHVEAAVFAPDDTIGIEQMYFVKREIVELRHAVMPLADPLRRVGDGGCGALVPDNARSHIRNVEDHLAGIAERVNSFDELLTALINATLAKVSVRQNNDMRRISAWVAIVSVPTMTFGAYGMNFDHMPELRWKYGYPLILSLTFVACLVLYRLFKRNRWL